MQFSQNRIIMDGEELQCAAVGSRDNNYLMVNVYRNGVPVSQHLIPEELFTMGGTVKTGGHTYKAVRL